MARRRAAAFSFASPDIQLLKINGVVVQKVLLRGPEGKLVLARYEMVRIGESWRINGCALTDPPGKEI